MKSPLERLEAFQFETAEFEPRLPNTLVIRGQITVHNPATHLEPYILSVHQAVLAQKLPEFEVDLTGLTFVNSSMIRIFVDWATWLTESETPYRLIFRTNAASAWQRSAFAAIRALAGDVVRINPVTV